MKWRFEEEAPPWVYNRRRDPSMREMLEERDFLKEYDERLKKDIKDKEANEKNKKIQIPKFSFLETFSLFFLSGFVIGPFVAMYVYMEFMVKLLEKAKVLGPLLQGK